MSVCNEPSRDSHGLHRPIYVNPRYRVTAHAISRLESAGSETPRAEFEPGEPFSRAKIQGSLTDLDWQFW